MKPVIPPPVQGALAAALMWAIDRATPGLAVSFAGQKLLAVGLAVAGLLIILIAIAAFIRAKTTVNPLDPQKANALVVSGLYRISRNPMYLGVALILAGWASWLGNPAAALVAPIWMTVMTWVQIKPEEKALRENFGAEYEDYCRRVRRWI